MFGLALANCPVPTATVGLTCWPHPAACLQIHWDVANAYPMAFSTSQQLAAAAGVPPQPRRIFDSLVVFGVSEVMCGEAQFFNLGCF